MNQLSVNKAIRINADTTPAEYRIAVKLMGSAFELVICHNDERTARSLLQEGIDEINRIEDLLSEFRPGSDTYKINENAGKAPVRCDAETFSLIERCIQISSLTRGAFDITTAPLKKCYDFRNEVFELPAADKINEALRKTGYRKILLDQEQKKVFLPLKGMHISFAAIGKGYAADKVKKIWLRKGVSSAVISASGDLTAIGSRPDGSPWRIGIADPQDKSRMSCFIPIVNSSVATSGNYEQYFIHNAKRYSHNINPVTGQPVSGIASVTIVSKIAELADALATAVYIMGKDTGLHFISQFPDTHCIIIDDKGSTYYSDKINMLHEN